MNDCEVLGGEPHSVLLIETAMATIHRVTLNELPAEVQVPDHLKERFWYDAEQKRLCFDGFMSKSTYDRLESLSHDGPYQHAIEELFRVSLPEDALQKSTGKRAVMIAVVGLAAVCGVGIVVMLLMRQS